MWNDEIVDEVRHARERYVAEHHDDFNEIYHDLQAKEQASGRIVISLPPKLSTQQKRACRPYPLEEQYPS